MDSFESSTAGPLGFTSNCIRSLVTILDDGLEQIKAAKNIDPGHLRLVQSTYR